MAIIAISAVSCSPGLQKEIEGIIAGKDAETGVSIALDGKHILSIGDNSRYPLMSVMKLHQAMSVADSLSRAGLGTDTEIHIGKDELLENTYSPLRDKYPEGNIDMSIAGLMEYTLQFSDNNACDILFSHFGGPASTDGYIRSIGIEDFSISATEDDMHKDLDKCYDNRTSPSAAMAVLEHLLDNSSLRAKAGNRLVPYYDFIIKTMTECRTGADRLAAPLDGTEAVIGHKTGTGDRNADGRTIGTNDIGFVILPDGRIYTIAVFVKDSSLSPRETSGIIARISEAAYRHISSGRI